MISAEIQSRIQNLLDTTVEDGKERGVQVAAYVNGTLLVDGWSGMADASQGLAVDAETLFPVFSTTKGMAATILNLLVERGQIDYDTRVAEVWPEFAAHGKQDITLRQCMTHTASLPHVPQSISPENLHNWDAVCAALADSKPAWPPGTRMEYHAMTYGWLLGEVAQRVDGRRFSQIVQDEICQQLNIHTLFAGLPTGTPAQIARLEMPDFEMPQMDDSPQAVPGWVWPLHEMMNRPEAHRACQPASNGLMNARAIARHYAALLPGGVDGIELLPPERIRKATVWQKLTAEDPLRMGLGYMLGGEDSVMGGISAFGHGGYGGSLGFADPATGLAFGLTKNLFSSAETVSKVVTALRENLSHQP